MKRPDGPLLVFGPRSPTYDFGPSHPLTPRRFGPGIELLRAVGAEPGLAPEPARDADLLRCHAERYIAAVRRLSEEPWGLPEAGLGHGGDNPTFAGMHEAAAAVAGGSLRAVEAILRGDVEHAFHPGGGLHHAMRDRASGFCIYDDPALAIARAREEGLRVLYLDFDVHHGDGVQALFWDDPGVLTVSFHETGRYLFPGTGSPDELGEEQAAGTSVNVPFDPYAGESAWLPAVEALVPALASAFGPDLVVSQHGADSHAWDPLAHLRVTTTAMGAAARLVDRIAHRYAGGRWLATGGGGYDAYRVVPRTWSHVWLAGAHRPAPEATPEAWRERWSVEASRYGQAPLPSTFDDPRNAGEPVDRQQEAAERASVARWRRIRSVVLPALLVEAEAQGWWSPGASPGEAAGSRPSSQAAAAGEPTLVDLSPEVLERLRLAPRVIPPADPAEAHEVLLRALAAGPAQGGGPARARGPAQAGGAAHGGRAQAAGAVVGDVLVGVVLAFGGRLLALGVAPDHRRRGLASALLGRLAARGHVREATVTVAERDPVDPLPRSVRLAVARRILERTGFTVGSADQALREVDREALTARR